ncbi:MAG: hypothetical protein EXR77_10990 [Myxococcales bacterium]|nr:hypothetical protein [Myxococcales bacterium]
MINRRRGLGLAQVCFAVLNLTWAASLWAAEPCGGIHLESGVVKAGKALPAKTDLQGDDLVCAKAVGAALVARSQIRSITVAVKVASDKRNYGVLAAAAWTKVLVGAGIPEARVSMIVPTLAPGSPSEVSIAYREPAPRPVALVQAMTGKVQSGPDPTKLGPASTGTQLVQGDVVSTDKGAVARLALADGSFVSLLGDTMIKLGRVELTADLKRAVRLDLLKGKVEAIADSKGAGSSFDIVTKTAIAGVRGTKFRVGESDSGATIVETVEGKVELKSELGAKQVVIVEAGHAAEVDSKGTASPPRPLLAAAAVDSPLSGEVERSQALKWQAVANAKTYRVEIAADGELATRLQVVVVAATILSIPKEIVSGHWFWRVTAVDSGDVFGLPSKTYSFSLR